MESEEAIKQFILDVYGYGRIEEIVGLGSKRFSLTDYLDDTIIGTWRSMSNYDDTSQIFVNWPRISTVKDYSNRFSGKDFSISNRSFFGEMSYDDTGDFFRERVCPLFPDTDLETTKGRTKAHRWTYVLNTEDLGVFVAGSSSHNAKRFDVGFNASPEFVDRIRKVVRRYYGKMQAISGDRVKRVKHRGLRY